MDTQIESTKVVKQVPLKCVPMSSLFIDNHQIHALGYRIGFQWSLFCAPGPRIWQSHPQVSFPGHRISVEPHSRARS